MNSNKIINNILRYIDEHIEEELSVKEISYEAGYSEFHFLRIFKEEMKMTLKEYITRRKLIKASEQIIDGKKIIDVAIQYGWESHAGFTKAFKKEFGFSPSFLRIMLIEIQAVGGNGMSHVFLDSTNIGISKEELFSILLDKVQKNGIEYNASEMEQIFALTCKAYSGIKRYSGEEYVTHPINVAILLADMEAEKETIYAGLFCDVLKKGNMSLRQLEEAVPECVVDIIKEIYSFDNKQAGNNSDKVVLIKLAERLHNMRTIQFLKEDERKKKAAETVELFLPMARQIENQRLVDELNDLSVKYL